MSQTKPPVRVLELYSGIGGMHCGLKHCFARAKDSLPYSSFHVVTAIDVNDTASAIYRHNFPSVLNQNRSVDGLNLKELTEMHIDLVTMSPPCQPFTRQGLQRDNEDNRTQSLFHFLKLLEEMDESSLPKYILVENVLGFETSSTRNSLVVTLNKVGFCFQEFLLSPPHFGIPNSRLRYFLIGKRKSSFCFKVQKGPMKVIPDEMPMDVLRFQLNRNNGSAPPIKNDDTIIPISHFLDDGDNSEFHLPDKVLKRFMVMDLTTASSVRSCCFTKAYGHYVEGTGSFLQMNEDVCRDDLYESIKKDHGLENEDKLDPNKLTEADFNLLRTLKLRYFTPEEVSRIHCLTSDFTFPIEVSRKARWKALGNSLNAHIVSVLLQLLLMNG